MYPAETSPARKSEASIPLRCCKLVRIEAGPDVALSERSSSALGAVDGFEKDEVRRW